jgi:hypothetical protein
MKEKNAKSLHREKRAHAGSGDKKKFPLSSPKWATGIEPGKEKWRLRSAAPARDKKTSREKQNPLQVLKENSQTRSSWEALEQDQTRWALTKTETRKTDLVQKRKTWAGASVTSRKRRPLGGKLAAESCACGYSIIDAGIEQQQQNLMRKIQIRTSLGQANRTQGGRKKLCAQILSGRDNAAWFPARGSQNW